MNAVARAWSAGITIAQAWDMTRRRAIYNATGSPKLSRKQHFRFYANPERAAIAALADIAEPYIDCPTCWERSHHPSDVSERYCGHCGYHDE